MPRINNPYERQHINNLAKYAKLIDQIFKVAAQEAAAIGVSAAKGKISTSSLFSFDDHPLTQAQIQSLLSRLTKHIETAIINGIDAEWTLANNKNNELARRVFADNIGRLTQAQYRQYFSTNDNARQAFLERKEKGLNLSERVWRYANEFKDEMELGLDVGIRNGLDADAMSRELRQYLRHPDKLFRRVCDEHGNLVLSKRAADFHPGQGVYRSSYKNARRLAVTETNIAYRTADYERIQQLDFVVGIEVCLSNNHPIHDICDDLCGRYPKDFKFTGWHPHCRCHTKTILKTEEELMEENAAILRGEEPPQNSVNSVSDVPRAFKKWVKDNEYRIKTARSLPYFMQDNGTINNGKFTLKEFGKAICEQAATTKIVIDDPYRYHPSGDTTTPIEIIQPTKEALAELEDILLDKAIAVVSEKALDVGNDVQSLAEQIASKYDAVCTPINYKSAESIKRKVLLERQNPLTANFTPEMLKDAVRTTIIAPQDKIASVIDSLKKNELFLRYKSQGGDEYIGYVGNIVNIKTTNGLAAEIQINTAKMIYAKELPENAKKILGEDVWNAIRKEVGVEGGLGHKYYEEWRILSDEQKLSAKGQALKKKSEEYYSRFKD